MQRFVVCGKNTSLTCSKDINESVIFYIVRYVHSATFLCVAKTLLLHVQNVVKLALVKINTGESSLFKLFFKDVNNKNSAAILGEKKTSVH